MSIGIKHSKNQCLFKYNTTIGRHSTTAATQAGRDIYSNDETEINRYSQHDYEHTRTDKIITNWENRNTRTMFFPEKSRIRPDPTGSDGSDRIRPDPTGSDRIRIRLRFQAFLQPRIELE